MRVRHTTKCQHYSSYQSIVQASRVVDALSLTNLRREFAPQRPGSTTKSDTCPLGWDTLRCLTNTLLELVASKRHPLRGRLKLRISHFPNSNAATSRPQWRANL